MNTIVILFLVIFLLNIIPAFAPPTWMVFSFIGFRFPDHMNWTFALVGAFAATAGRMVLGKLSRWIVRNHWLGESGRENVDALKMELEKRPKLTFGVFLFYAFTPLPSNYLFIAYGLTTMPLTRIVIPFFLDRSVSYFFWTMSAAAVSRKLDMEESTTLGYFGVYFVVTQIALLAAVYVFTKIDWKSLLRQRRWKWLKRTNTNNNA